MPKTPSKTQNPKIGSAAAVQSLLDRRGGYDCLAAQDQAIVRAHWAQGIEEARKGLRLDRVLAAQGHKIVELDAQGEVSVRRVPPKR